MRPLDTDASVAVSVAAAVHSLPSHSMGRRVTRADLPLWFAAIFVALTGVTMLAGSVSAAACSITGTVGTSQADLLLTGFPADTTVTLTATRPDGTTWSADIPVNEHGNAPVAVAVALPGTYLYEARSGTCVASLSVSVGAAGSPPSAGPALTPTMPPTDAE